MKIKCGQSLGLTAFATTLWAIGLMAGFATATSAQTALFGAAHQGPDGISTFYSIDETTGTATEIGPIGFERVSGMDVHPKAGTLYATAERADGSDTPVLIKIDPSTGKGWEVAVLNGGARHSFGDAYADISFRNSDKILYAYLEKDGGLGTIDIWTGALTELGLTGPITYPTCCGNGMAFSPANDLFHSNDSNLNTLDQELAVSTSVALMNFPISAEGFPRVNGMDYHPDTDVLFASMKSGFRDSSVNFLATIDTDTGGVTIIGPTVAGLNAIAWMPDRRLALTDHYKCYEVEKRVKHHIDPVDLLDEFGEELDVRVRKPEMFCNPVVKNNERDLVSPEAHLTCYKIKSRQHKRTIEIENQFGVQKLVIDDSELVCVPTLKLNMKDGDLIREGEDRHKDKDRDHEKDDD